MPEHIGLTPRKRKRKTMRDMMNRVNIRYVMIGDDGYRCNELEHE